MAQEYGGLYPDNKVQQQIKSVGNRLFKSFKQTLATKNIKEPLFV